MRRVYELFDGDHDGVIDADELAAVLCGGGLGGDSEDELCVPDAVPAALRRVDADGALSGRLPSPTKRGGEAFCCALRAPGILQRNQYV